MEKKDTISVDVHVHQSGISPDEVGKGRFFSEILHVNAKKPLLQYYCTP
jgi:hypothetical protein